LVEGARQKYSHGLGASEAGTGQLGPHASGKLIDTAHERGR